MIVMLIHVRMVVHVMTMLMGTLVTVLVDTQDPTVGQVII